VHHRYEIVEKANSKVQKAGISGQKLNKNGTSPHANKIPGREAALKSEQEANNKLSAENHPLELQELPQPQPTQPQAGGSP
jgi:hypothetical protein